MNDKKESIIFNSNVDEEDNIYEVNNNNVNKDLIREIDSLCKREFFADKDFTLIKKLLTIINGGKCTKRPLKT